VHPSTHICTDGHPDTFTNCCANISANPTDEIALAGGQDGGQESS
jgi:hypothetical protein